MLGVIWWMYGSYAWATSMIVLHNSRRRMLLMVGMSGFLLIALAVPRAFQGGGLAFGLGYVLITVVHSLLLLKSEAQRMRWVVLARLAPLNAGSALLVLIGGIAPANSWRYGLWGAALILQIVTPYFYPQPQATQIHVEHFAERHGLVLIIALGESIVAIGVGAQGLPLTPLIVVTALLGLTLAYYLWWCYFGEDNERAERALDRITEPARRTRVALHAFGYAYYPLLFSVVLLSVGVKKVIGHATEHAKPSTALLLAGGVALFLFSESWFRQVLKIGAVYWRVAGAFAILATVPLGVYGSSIVQLTAMVLLFLGVFLLEWRGPGSEWRKVRAEQPG
jgi:low temperature requirement protein LtrA